MSLPDDGRTDLSDLVTIGNAIGALIPPAFIQGSFGLGLVYAQDCPSNTNVIKFPIMNALIAEAVTEGAVYIPSDANSDLNITSVTATAVKKGIVSPITVESLRFGGGLANPAGIADEQGRALARLFDAGLLALFDGLSNAVTASSTLDIDTLLQARYVVDNGLCPPGPRVAVLDYKGVNELRKLVANSGAAIWSSQYSSPIFGTPAANGFVGNMLGIDIYQATGLSTTGSDDQGALFDPRYCFAAAMGGAPETNIRWTGAGVASQVAGFSYEVSSHAFWHVLEWHDAAGCEVRSDT